MIGNNKGLNSVAYDQNVVAQKTNVVPPYFDEMECHTSFPHDNLEVMQDTLRSKFGKANKEIFTSLDSDRGSTFQQRTSIRKSKGYSVVSSDTNVLAHNKNLRQPDFSQIEHDTAFPHDELETLHAMFFISSSFPSDLLLSFLCYVICLSTVFNVTLTSYSLVDYIYVTIDLSTLWTKIQELLQVEPSLTNIEVVERCFGPQSKSHVVGFDGGITSKDLKGGSVAKTALFEELKASQK
uniref:Uncharacterized protein n=1 Tax=Solanum tuberosum TaxID=4113 RepID=M1DE89_SOLTU